MEYMEQRKQIKEYLNRGRQIKEEELHYPEPGILMPPYISGPKYDKWISEIHIFSNRYLSNHLYFKKINHACENYKRRLSAYEEILNYLTAIYEDDEYWTSKNTKSNKSNTNMASDESEIVLLRLISIQETGNEITIEDSDKRFSDIKGLDRILKHLNSEGYFDYFLPNIVGEYDIELSEKALNYKAQNKSFAKAPTQQEINYNFYGEINNSNLTNGNESIQTNIEKPNSEKKNWAEKYLIPIIVALIGAVGAIVVAIINNLS